MPRLHPNGELHDAIAQGTASVVEHLGDISGYSTGIGWGSHTIGQTNEDLEALYVGPGPRWRGTTDLRGNWLLALRLTLL